VVNQLALTKMSTALASWRTWVKKQIDKKESWEEIKKHEPLLEHDDYVLFKEELETDTALGKKMYEQNIGHHCLGSGGSRRIQPVCDAEDASLFVLASPTCLTNSRTHRSGTLCGPATSCAPRPRNSKPQTRLCRSSRNSW
jgi:hypothetical protein